MPLSKPRERLMLRALNRYGTGPDGCAQAWLSLPHSMRVFYLHAYCSRSAANSCTRTHNTTLSPFSWQFKRIKTVLLEAFVVFIILQRFFVFF